MSSWNRRISGRRCITAHSCVLITSVSINTDHEAGEADVPQFKPRHRLALLLEEADVSVEEMALAIGRATPTVYAYLNGDRNPKLDTIKMWAIRCGKPHLWRWVQTGEPPEPNDGGGLSTIWYERRRLTLCVSA